MSPDTAIRLAMATVVVAMVGAFLIAAALRLGALSAFISRPVLRGFAFGLAATIILKQLPVIVGVPVPATDLWRLISGLAASAPTWHPASLATGALALVALMLLRRLRSLPGAFLVLAAGVTASFALNLPARGVATVGEITLAAPVFTFPALPWHTLVDLGQLVVPLVLVLFAESWGTIRALALRHGDATEPNGELGALGFANVAAALAQGHAGRSRFLGRCGERSRWCAEPPDRGGLRAGPPCADAVRSTICRASAIAGCGRGGDCRAGALAILRR